MLLAPLAAHGQTSMTIEQKMKAIIIPAIEFRQANVIDVLEFLVEATTAADPDGYSIGLIEPNTPTTREYYTYEVEGGAPLELHPLTLNYTRISMSDAFDRITKEVGLTYRVENNTINFYTQDGKRIIRTKHVEQVVAPPSAQGAETTDWNPYGLNDTDVWDAPETGSASVAASNIPVYCHVRASVTNITMGTRLPVILSISNISDAPITLDFTPDEILRERTEQYGQASRPRGSQLTAYIFQGKPVSRFITIGGKMGVDHSPAVTLQPDECYQETVTLPTASGHYLASAPLIPGPSRVTIEVQLILGTNTYYIESTTDPVMLERDSKPIASDKESL